MDRYSAQRARMVAEQLEGRGFHDTKVLAAMRRIPRHLFVAPGDQIHAYEDRSLPVGHGQTISQPYVVAFMCQALELDKDSKVLDVGTGTGYAAAIIAELSETVFGIERIPELADFARTNLKSAGYSNIRVHCGDGCLGLLDETPFDAINVGAGAPVEPEQLKKQLAIGGRLVIPVGSSRRGQHLKRIRRLSDEEYETETLGNVVFVPLIGSGAWPEPK